MKSIETAPVISQGDSSVISRILAGQFLQTVSVISFIGDLTDILSWTQALVQLI